MVVRPNWSVATKLAVWLPLVVVSSVDGPAQPVMVRALLHVNDVGTTAPAWYRAFGVGGGDGHDGRVRVDRDGSHAWWCRPVR